MTSTPIIDIGSRWEIFVDQLLIDELTDAELRLHEPRLMPRANSVLPWCYTTVIKDGGIYRGYYRDYRVGSGYENSLPRKKQPDAGSPREELAAKSAAEITCYAESSDGHEWTFPDLGLLDARSIRGGNAILSGANPCSHNFSPFLDTRPGVPKHERFKALCGTHTCGGGLHALASGDGLRWVRMHEGPVLSSQKIVELGNNPGCPGLDSQNAAFWSEAEQLYVCFLRVNIMRAHGPLRSIGRITSEDFIHWSDPQLMDTGLPEEQIYSSVTHPYFRAPHIYVSLPTRFLADRGSSTDILFMAARAGSDRFERLFREALIRPGFAPAGWGNRGNFAALNVVPTGPAEMSIYNCGTNWGDRYTLRTDGFVSVRAGSRSGSLLTKPLTFSGDTLVLNYSTSAAGSVRVALCEPDGRPIPGFTPEDCQLLVGDSIEQPVVWKDGANLTGLAGRPVRLHFTLQECDLYGLGFRHLKESANC